MHNDLFFDEIFPTGYWENLKTREYPTDPHNMFGDGQIFEFLIEKFRPEYIIEVGSWKGHSANFMADIARKNDIAAKIVCVDTYLGASEHWLIPELKSELHIEYGQPTILERLIGNTIARGNDGVIFPFPLDAHAAANVFKRKAFRADMIFIDAAHDYGNVTRDLNNYWDLLAEHGVMFGDDYQYFEVANAVHDFAKEKNIKVLVGARKWLFYPDWLVRKEFPSSFDLRSSFDGWTHP